MAEIIAFVPQPDRVRPPHVGPGVRYPFLKPGTIVCGVASLGQPPSVVQHVMGIKSRVDAGKARRDALRGIVLRAPVLLLTPAPHPLLNIASIVGAALMVGCWIWSWLAGLYIGSSKLFLCVWPSEHGPRPRTSEDSAHCADQCA